MDIPLDEFLNLESNPGASKTIYLDFDGHHSVNNSWGHDIVFPAWDRSRNPLEFSDSEKRVIIGHWLEVVEDFAIFGNVNVTTKDPGLDALIRSNSSDENFGIRVIMSQITEGFGHGTGGDYEGSTNTENDFAIMTSSSNGITLAPDDHPNGTSSGTTLISDVPVAGLITTAADTDAFTFSATGGDVVIDLVTAEVGPNIDLMFTLYRDAPFQLVEEVTPSGTWLASRAFPALPAGSYTLVVDGTFESQPSGPVSDYGSVGTYTVSMIETPTSQCLADTNNDGILSPADFSAWVTAFNTQSPECDQNDDQDCSPADFSAWVANYNAGCE